jgi:hypothetical protein
MSFIQFVAVTNLRLNSILFVRSEVFTAMTMKNDVFWDVALQSAAICSRWFVTREFFYPEYGSKMFLRNAGSYKIYTVPHPRRRHSSFFFLFFLLLLTDLFSSSHSSVYLPKAFSLSQILIHSIRFLSYAYFHTH